ncbi:MAG: acyl-CoA dehydrogenase family protein [Microthrixaceae bacterium]|jgi:alkylation response protein AidB-like acyl-CoA dehydrogenase|nr:acyl-CoA dehydrogenase family protein [Microthrixaceae bacterium]HMS11790.1 acyl-CoA dehydrogenase family protein [Microthrixaceae bacterium]HMT63041.1 acyl-CoA dehydrogenase family protein [Microthrixaceae bacterium]
MNLDFTPDEDAFREEARTWLADHLPAGPRPPEGDEMRAFDLAWQRTLYDGGWAGINWPVEFGGRGLTDIQQMIWYEEFARAEPPFTLNNSCTFVGNNHGGPTLIVSGSDEQKAFHLPKILRGDVVWCQGFSEPGAGSDLASLSCRAEIDGDELVVNGQKIWTSYAHVADFQELLVRTDPSAPKHKGISWVICDMRTPGIEIREITTMSHVNDFCEVFYDDVRIPLTNVVGRINDGWRVTMTTLSFERGTAFMADQVELAAVVERLIDEARTRTGPDGRRAAIADDEIARRLATARAEVTALRAMTIAGISRVLRTGVPGPEGSMVRLFHGELHQRVYQLALDIIGADALRLTSIDGHGNWTGPYLQSFAYTIGGGTTDIQRNIVGERVLGLPRV